MTESLQPPEPADACHVRPALSLHSFDNHSGRKIEAAGGVREQAVHVADGVDVLAQVALEGKQCDLVLMGQ